jgi:hypothetical protein
VEWPEFRHIATCASSRALTFFLRTVFGTGPLSRRGFAANPPCW